MIAFTRILTRTVLVCVFATGVTGCIYDAPKPRASITNQTMDAITGEVTGTDRSFLVEASSELDLGDEACYGDGMVVTAEDGVILAVIDGALCASTAVVVRGDGTVQVEPEIRNTIVGPAPEP